MYIAHALPFIHLHRLVSIAWYVRTPDHAGLGFKDPVCGYIYFTLIASLKALGKLKRQSVCKQVGTVNFKCPGGTRVCAEYMVILYKLH